MVKWIWDVLKVLTSQTNIHRLIFVNMGIYSIFNLLKMSICTDVKDPEIYSFHTWLLKPVSALMQLIGATSCQQCPQLTLTHKWNIFLDEGMDGRKDLETGESHSQQTWIDVRHLTGHVTESWLWSITWWGPWLTDMMTLTLDRDH